MTTFAYFIVFIALGLTISVPGPSVTWLAKQTHSRLDQISLIFTAISLGYVIGSLISARGYGRFPGHHIQSAMLILISATMAMIPVVPWIWLLLIVFFLLGVGQAGVDVGCNTLIVWVHGGKVGPILNGLHFSVGIGFLTAPIVLAQVVGATGDIHWVYWSFALLILPVAALLWVIPSPKIQIESSDIGGEKVSHMLLGMFVVFFVFYVGAELGYGNWIFTYATQLNLATDTAAAYLTSAYWTFFTLGRLLAIGVATKLHPSTILYMDLLGCLIGLGAILLNPTSTTTLWMGTILLGLSTASVFPMMLVLAAERMRLTSMATGWFMVGSGIGGMFLPCLIGQLFEPMGPSVTMIIIFVALSTSLAVLFGLLHASGNNPKIFY